MKDDREIDRQADAGALSTLLRESRPAPPLPTRFQESVWRRIRAAEAEEPPPAAWLERWVGRLLLPRFALVALSLLLAGGVLAGSRAGAHDAKAYARERYLASVAPGTLR